MAQRIEFGLEGATNEVDNLSAFVPFACLSETSSSKQLCRQSHASFSTSKLPFPRSLWIEAIGHQWSTQTRAIIDTNHIRHDGRRRPVFRQPIMTEDDGRLNELIRFPLARCREPRVRHVRIGRKNGVGDRSFGVRFEPPTNPDLCPLTLILIEKAQSWGQCRFNPFQQRLDRPIFRGFPPCWRALNSPVLDTAFLAIAPPPAARRRERRKSLCDPESCRRLRFVRTPNGLITLAACPHNHGYHQ